MTQAEINHAHSQEMQRVLHDLSNTLTGLLMNAGLLSLALRSNAHLRRYADDIHESATHGADLLRQAQLMIESGETAATVVGEVTHGRDAQHTSDRDEVRSKRTNHSTRTQ